MTFQTLLMIGKRQCNLSTPNWSFDRLLLVVRILETSPGECEKEFNDNNQ